MVQARPWRQLHAHNAVTAQANITGQGKGAKGEVRTGAEVSPFYLNRFSAPLLPNTLLLEGV